MLDRKALTNALFIYLYKEKCEWLYKHSFQLWDASHCKITVVNLREGSRDRLFQKLQFLDNGGKERKRNNCVL